MNYTKILRILGKIMILEGVLMCAPLIVTFCYKETLINKLAFIIPILILFTFGFILKSLKSKRNNLYQKEGFALVGLVWIIMTLFGALPFVINGDIPNYIDALFETMSGFTTTGSSIINDVTKLSHSSLFWRSFTHWIGGMGILVFILIFIPESDDGSSLHLLKAESPGPQVGKIVSKMKVTTRILYSIYLGMTILEIIILLFTKPIPGYQGDHLFFSMLTAFGCAGTGGFGFIPGSMELFSPATQYIISIFLILFGINFSLYYLLLIGKFKEVFKSEELKTYFLIIFIAISTICISLVTRSAELLQVYTKEEVFRHSLFQVSSIMTTTGFSSTDFNLWPMVAQLVLIILMFIGGMAGSTAGGLKLSRIIICIKGFGINIRKLINPRYVPKTKFEGKSLDDTIINDVFSYITLFIFIFIATLFILSCDPVNGSIIEVTSSSSSYTVEHGFLTNFSATLATICNIGPGLEAVGPYSSFAHYSYFSKSILTFVMLIGRLEVLPILILFSKKTWKKA